MSHLDLLESCSCGAYGDGFNPQNVNIYTLLLGVLMMNVLTLAFAIVTLWRVNQLQQNQHVLHAKIQGILDLMTSIREAVVMYLAKVPVMQKRKAVM